MQLKLHSDGENVTASVAHDDGAGGLAPPLPLSTKSVDEFLESFHAGRNFEMGLLPPAVRWISKDKQLVVFERLPMRQRISFIPMKKDFIQNGVDYSQYECSYELNIPWTVYLVSFDRTYLPGKIKVYTRNHPLQSLNDPIGLLPLLNFYNNSMLCNPVFGSFEGMPQSLAEGINLAYNMVWNSGWNYDLVDAINSSCHIKVPFRRIPTAKPDTYSEAEKNAHGQGLVNYFKYWESLSMEEVLSLYWPSPSLGQRDPLNIGKVLTLAECIDFTRSEISNEYPKLRRTFLVNLVSNLV